jgi:hypothetical protein
MGGARPTWRIRFFARRQPQAAPLSRSGDPELVPVFTTDFTRSFWLLTPQEGTRIEVALDRGKIVAGDHQETICEVELELLEGNVADLFDARSPCRPNCRCIPKRQQGRARLPAGQRTALTPVRAADAALEMGMTSIAVFRSTVFSCLAQLQGNERGVRETDAPEYIHQARVAMRRLRSAIRLWRPLLPEDTSATSTRAGGPWPINWATPATGTSSSPRSCRRSQGVSRSCRPAAAGQPGQQPPGRLPQGGAGGDDRAHLLAVAARIHRRHRRPPGKQEAANHRLCARAR